MAGTIVDPVGTVLDPGFVKQITESAVLRESVRKTPTPQTGASKQAEVGRLRENSEADQARRQADAAHIAAQNAEVKAMAQELASSDVGLVSQLTEQIKQSAENSRSMERVSDRRSQVEATLRESAVRTAQLRSDAAAPSNEVDAVDRMKAEEFAADARAAEVNQMLQKREIEVKLSQDKVVTHQETAKSADTAEQNADSQAREARQAAVSAEVFLQSVGREGRLQEKQVEKYREVQRSADGGASDAHTNLISSTA